MNRKIIDIEIMNRKIMNRNYMKNKNKLYDEEDEKRDYLKWR